MSKIYHPKTVEQRAAIANWAAQQVPWLKNGDAFGPCEAWAIVHRDTDEIMGALIFNNYRSDIGDIELNVITLHENWASQDVFRMIADYVFNILKCNRMSCTLPRGAKRNRDHAVKVGFKLEGTKRAGFYNGVDAMIYGMLKTECRFLEKREAA